MPFIINTDEAITPEDFPLVLAAVRDLYVYFEARATVEGSPRTGQVVEHARQMQANLQTMIAAFYCHQEAVSMRQALAAVADENVRDALEDQIDNKAGADVRLAQTAHGGSDPDLDYIWKIPQFLAAYFHAQRKLGEGEILSQTEIQTALALVGEEEEVADHDIGLVVEEESEDEDEDDLPLEESK